MTRTRTGSSRGHASAFVLLAVLLACSEDGPTAPDGEAVELYAVTFDNRLLHFTSDAPATFLSNRLIAGLPAGERLVSIDFRPSDGQLFGVGTDDRVYSIALSSATATAVAGAFATGLDGEHFGLAFDPAADRIRTSSVETEQNLRLNPADGSLSAADADYAFAAGDPNAAFVPAVAALAHTNSVPGATSTVLYAIDSGSDVLVTVSNPNSGVLTTVGSLGANTVPCASFDIDPRDGVGWATLADDGISRLYRINLSTGAATLVGTVLDGPEVQGLAVAPE